MKAKTLIHLTLNTGHRRPSPRSEVGDEALAVVAPLVHRGGGALPPPFNGYDLTIIAPEESAAAFTVERRRILTLSAGKGQDQRAPLISGFCCWRSSRAAGYWALVGASVHQFAAASLPARLPPRPATTPWLAILLWPSFIADPGPLGWLGDFERCVAWALIESGPERSEG